MSGPFTSPVARSTPFDNSTNGFIALDVQAAIEEVSDAVNSSVSAFIASYGANANTGRYLEIFPNISSDVAPIIIPIALMDIKAITLGAIAASTGTVGIFKTSNLVTPVQTISLTNQTRIYQTGLNIDFFQDEEIAIRVTAGSISKPFMRIWISGVL